MKKSSLFLLLAAAFLAACASVVNQPLTTVPLPAATLSADCPFQAAESGLSAPPADLYGKQPLAEAQVNVEDFVFRFWLYCDPALQLENQEAAYSAIPGLGLFASWRYNGPQVSGLYADFYGFEPDIFTSSAVDGPFYRAGSSYRSGITLSAEAAQEHLQQAAPFLYHIGLETPSGKKEAVFSFTLTLNQGKYALSAVTGK